MLAELLHTTEGAVVMPNNPTLKKIFLGTRFNEGITGDDPDRDLLGRRGDDVGLGELTVLGSRLRRTLTTVNALSNVIDRKEYTSGPESLYTPFKPVDLARFAYWSNTQEGHNSHQSIYFRIKRQSENPSTALNNLTCLIEDNDANVWFDTHFWIDQNSGVVHGNFVMDIPTVNDKNVYHTGGYLRLSEMRLEEYRVIEPYLTKYLQRTAQERRYR